MWRQKDYILISNNLAQNLTPAGSREISVEWMKMEEWAKVEGKDPSALPWENGLRILLSEGVHNPSLHLSPL